ncbi:MAG: hypothetical protein KIC78_00465 [Prevotella sp.]|uniref:hypothetical protein n=1 Tax=Prevotella sp. TaxID=59823 RepID=UPI0025799A51|nr:hypothetical protein [Prevotella sp.]MBS5874626.1 hypothetical protein [Prevotella sp.]
MKKHRYLAAACLLLLSLLAVSCISDDYPVRDKATVKMTFTTRAISNPTTTAGGLEANEHMRTLRVIVARQNGEILYNLKYDIAENETSKTITFSEMTVNANGETFDFYAIANEEGVEYNGWENVTVADLKGMNLQSGFLTNANASKNTMIPQTAYKQIRVAPQSGGGIQSETMKLDFAVAKVRLTINNTSSAVQTVSDINLSGLNMESTPLFASGTLSGETGGTLSLGNMTIDANSTATVYAYFFENTGGDYALTANWNGNLHALDIKAADITEISRGTELNINIKLNATIPSSPEFYIEVVPWAEVEVDVPPFEVPQFK